MWCAASCKEAVNDASHFGINVASSTFDWATLKERRDNWVKRLNGVYQKGLNKAGVTHMKGTGTITGPNTIDVDGKTFKVWNCHTVSSR